MITLAKCQFTTYIIFTSKAQQPNEKLWLGIWSVTVSEEEIKVSLMDFDINGSPPVWNKYNYLDSSTVFCLSLIMSSKPASDPPIT